MCGLVGVVGLLSEAHRKAFKTLITVDAVRGEHSTGVAAIGFTAPHTILKTVGGPSNLNPFVSWGRTGYVGAARGLIGHNRFATVGGITEEAAHPYVQGDIIGAHNGTLDNHKTALDSAKYVTDSEALFASINDVGLKQTLEKTLGAWALTYYNRADDTMNFIRNKQRPLWFARTDDRSALFWASEEWMLYSALGRAGIKHGDLFELETDQHMRVSLTRNHEFKNRDLELVETISGKVEPAYTAPWFRGSYYQNNSRSNVTPITKSTPASNNRVSGRAKPLTQLTGRIVKFDFDFHNVADKHNKEEYLVGYYNHPDLTDEVEVRVYGNKQKWNDWLTETDKFEGRVKSVGSVRYQHPTSKLWINESYLVLNANTIKLSPEEVDDDIPFNVADVPKGFGGVYLTPYEFIDRTSNGCVCCSADARLGDISRVTFLDRDVFVCYDCISDTVSIETLINQIPTYTDYILRSPHYNY